jgi:hypothetical protein
MAFSNSKMMQRSSRSWLSMDRSRIWSSRTLKFSGVNLLRMLRKFFSTLVVRSSSTRLLGTFSATWRGFQAFSATFSLTSLDRDSRMTGFGKSGNFQNYYLRRFGQFCRIATLTMYNVRTLELWMLLLQLRRIREVLLLGIELLMFARKFGEKLKEIRKLHRHFLFCFYPQLTCIKLVC